MDILWDVTGIAQYPTKMNATTKREKFVNLSIFSTSDQVGGGIKWKGNGYFFVQSVVFDHHFFTVIIYSFSFLVLRQQIPSNRSVPSKPCQQHINNVQLSFLRLLQKRRTKGNVSSRKKRKSRETKESVSRCQYFECFLHAHPTFYQSKPSMTISSGSITSMDAQTNFGHGNNDFYK